MGTGYRRLFLPQHKLDAMRQDGNGDPESAMEENGDNPEDEADTPDMQETLRHRLMGPSLTKAGQDTVDQSKVRIREYIRYLPSAFRELSEKNSAYNHRSQRSSTMPLKAQSSSTTKKSKIAN